MTSKPHEDCDFDPEWTDKTASAWAKIKAKAKEHASVYPRFRCDSYLDFVYEQEQSYIRWAARQTVARVNKSRRSRESSERIPRRD